MDGMTNILLTSLSGNDARKSSGGFVHDGRGSEDFGERWGSVTKFVRLEIGGSGPGGGGGGGGWERITEGMYQRTLIDCLLSPLMEMDTTGQKQMT